MATAGTERKKRTITEIRDSIAPPAMLETMRTMREEGVPGKPGGP